LGPSSIPGIAANVYCTLSPGPTCCGTIRDEVGTIRQRVLRTGTDSLMTTVEQHGISWERDWDAAIHSARQERRLLLIDVEKDH
jgi:type IV secretory pathway VirB4 component